MNHADLVDRMAALDRLSSIPRAELTWLAEHGQYMTAEQGLVLAPRGERIEKLWIILSGRVAVKVDRGIGPRLVTAWHAGEVSGMLPYSRMTGPPGDNYVDAPSELVEVHEEDFPEMIHRCPRFTAYTVHSMLDRARSFNASDLQDEKMASLGKLAAGMAHELNNPAAAAVRNAKLLIRNLVEADDASRALGASELTDEQRQTIERVRGICMAKPSGGVLSALEQADREDELAEWLHLHGLDPEHATALAATAVSTGELDTLAEATSGDQLGTILRWLAAGCTTRALAVDIEQATTRVSDLVAAIKRFTFMDHRGGSESVDVEAGLRDSVQIVASKARARGAAIRLDIEEDLPRVRATGGELNQVWLNLIDNALDAIPDSGQVDVRARSDGNQVVVHVVDNGTGIPEDVLSNIFDPFFTTKAPGEGTGLGLDITRRLLLHYGGEISVQSRPGLTEFRVALPAASS